MTTPTQDHAFELPQGEKVPHFSEELTLQGETDLTGATVKFAYKRLEGTLVVRDAVILSSTPSTSKATKVKVKVPWITADSATLGTYAFQWRFYLSDGSEMSFPPSAPTEQDPERLWQTFRVVPRLA